MEKCSKEQEERCIQRQRAGLPQVMMMISVVPFQRQTPAPPSFEDLLLEHAMMGDM